MSFDNSSQFPLSIGSKVSDPVAMVERYQRILHSAIETAIITFDATGLVTGWSEGAYRLFGWTESEMIGQSLACIFSSEEDGNELLRLEIEQAARQGQGGAEGWRLRKNGEKFWAIGETRQLSTHSSAVEFVKVLRDRTEQRQIETTLRAQKKTLEILNRTGTTLAQETNLKSLVQIVTDAGVALTGARFGAFFYNMIDDSGESYTLYSISGVPKEEFSKFPMPRNTAIFSPTFSGVGIVRSDDITRDPRYGKNAPHSGMPTGHLPVRSYLAVPVISRNGSVLGGLFFGHPETGVFSEMSESNLTGLAGEAAVAIDNVRLFEEAQREINERRRAELALRNLNISLEEQVEYRTKELLKKEEALRQSQKMEAVGQLTGGIAHDFNNMLQVIVGNLDVLSRTLPADMPRQQRSVDQAMAGAKRAGSLTKRLLAFARKQPLDPRPLQINAVVFEMSELLGRALGETIHLETVGAGGLWTVEVDPNELESALLNLAVNSRDAMPTGGKLTIETSNAYLDDTYVSRHLEVTPGQYVAISVTDTGTGMNAETMSQAFEPFFTTKAEGKGTGLGLSQVYGFIKQSGGHVKIYSELGNGTTVRMYLPRWEGSATSEREPPAIFSYASGETILVVEDDADVRSYTVSALIELGYNVLESEDGTSATSILEKRCVDLVFTDVVLPGGMSGAEVAARAQQRWPGIKILFTTGYARNAIIHNGRLDKGVHLITKPFSFEDLATKLRSVLGKI